MPVSVLACPALTASIVAKPAAQNALLVGVNTVRILPPDKMAATFVIQVLAFITAATRKINVVSAEAISTMSPAGGSTTFEMVCIIPLLAGLSAVTTLIPFTKTPIAFLVTNTESPKAVTTLR